MDMGKQRDYCITVSIVDFEILYRILGGATRLYSEKRQQDRKIFFQEDKKCD